MPRWRIGTAPAGAPTALIYRIYHEQHTVGVVDVAHRRDACGVQR